MRKFRTSNLRTALTAFAFMFAIVLSLAVLFRGGHETTDGKRSSIPAAASSTAASSVSKNPAGPAPEEVRGVWLSFYELTLPKGTTQRAFTMKYAALLDRCQALGIHVLFLHVRPFGDAIYPSALFPWSEILTGLQGQNPGYDPLQIFCALAGARGIAVHGWINPFRAARTADITRLCAQSPALKHINAGDGWVQRANGQYFWNPAVKETHALIYEGVEELLERYPLAGIHIDDYFYPTTEKTFDAAQYEAYQKDGGALALADWRRALVSEFVAGLYSAVKQAKPAAVCSISPAADISKNAQNLYADVALWAREPGYCDWMIPQLYYGFENDTLPFERTARQWAALKRHDGCKLLFGLAAYKAGLEDEWAGAGKREWTQRDDVLARQVRLARTLPGYGGFALYSITGIVGERMTEIAKRERKNLQILLEEKNARP